MKCFLERLICRRKVWQGILEEQRSLYHQLVEEIIIANPEVAVCFVVLKSNLILCRLAFAQTQLRSLSQFDTHRQTLLLWKITRWTQTPPVIGRPSSSIVIFVLEFSYAWFSPFFCLDMNDKSKLCLIILCPGTTMCCYKLTKTCDDFVQTSHSFNRWPSEEKHAIGFLKHSREWYHV